MRASVLSKPGDAPGYAVRVTTQLRALGCEVGDWADDGALLVLVGPNWLTRPLDEQVVANISDALRADRQVIPVLVQGGLMPAAAKLPEGIQPFARLNAFTLRHESFPADMRTLCERLTREDRDVAWRDTSVSGRIRIVSTKPGTLLGLVRHIDPEQPVNVRIDSTTYGALHLYGDEMTVPIAAGRHEVLLRHRWEDPIEVVVPPGGEVTLRVTRSVLTGALTVSRETAQR